MIRVGTYTEYKGFDLTLNEARQEAPIPFTHFILRWESKKQCPIDQFEKDEFGYSKIFEKNEISNAYTVVTKARFDNSIFTAHPYLVEPGFARLQTEDSELASRLDFIPIRDGKGKAYFIKTIELEKIEEIWEERSPSQYDLPMPANIQQKKIITPPSQNPPQTSQPPPA